METIKLIKIKQGDNEDYTKIVKDFEEDALRIARWNAPCTMECYEAKPVCSMKIEKGEE